MTHLTPDLWWHCLHYNEWLTIQGIRGAALYSLGQISNIEFETVCLLSGLGNSGERRLAFTTVYKMTRVAQPLPPPLDDVWYLDSALWNEIEPIVAAEGSAEFAGCILFTFKGDQGGAWPVLWP